MHVTASSERTCLRLPSDLHARLSVREPCHHRVVRSWPPGSSQSGSGHRSNGSPTSGGSTPSTSPRRSPRGTTDRTIASVGVAQALNPIASSAVAPAVVAPPRPLVTHRTGAHRLYVAAAGKLHDPLGDHIVSNVPLTLTFVPGGIVPPVGRGSCCALATSRRACQPFCLWIGQSGLRSLPASNDSHPSMYSSMLTSSAPPSTAARYCGHVQRYR